MTTFNTWLKTLNSEKGIDLEQRFEVEGPSGTNSFNYGVVIEHILITTAAEKAAIKNVLVKIDFANGDIRDFYRHLAQAIAA